MIKLLNKAKESILATQIPTSTNTYKVVSHGQIIDSISENLDKQGLKIKSERYSANSNNTIVLGHLIIDVDKDKDLKFEIAFANSYNKTKRAIVVAGSQVLICENGHILGDVSLGLFKRKHVGKVSEDLNVFIPELIKSSDESFQKLINQKEKMKEIEISAIVRNELIGQLYIDDAIISDVQMSIIRKEIQNPSFDYGCDKNSLWQLYNNITVGLKNSHPSKWISNHSSLNKIIDNKFELV